MSGARSKGCGSGGADGRDGPKRLRSKEDIGGSDDFEDVVDVADDFPVGARTAGIAALNNDIVADLQKALSEVVANTVSASLGQM